MTTTVKGVPAQDWVVFYYNNYQIIADTTSKKVLRVRKSCPALEPDCEIEIDSEILAQTIEAIETTNFGE